MSEKKKHDTKTEVKASKEQENKKEAVTEEVETISPVTDAADDGKAANAAKPDAPSQAEKTAAEMQQRYLRLQADFVNYKKRTANEKSQISEVVKMDVLKNVLPVLDNFERALQVPQDKVASDIKSFIDGYAMIYKQLFDVLAKEGVTKMDAVGKPFDPNYHQAVMRVPSDEYENDTVVEVLQEGYLLGDKTLRPAMVKVAFNG